jgi:hypothetical protein
VYVPGFGGSTCTKAAPWPPRLCEPENQPLLRRRLLFRRNYRRGWRPLSVATSICTSRSLFRVDRGKSGIDGGFFVWDTRIDSTPIFFSFLFLWLHHHRDITGKRTATPAFHPLPPVLLPCLSFTHCAHTVLYTPLSCTTSVLHNPPPYLVQPVLLP